MYACENPALLNHILIHKCLRLPGARAQQTTMAIYVFVQQNENRSKTGKTLHLFDSLSNKNLELKKRESEREDFPDF